MRQKRSKRACDRIGEAIRAARRGMSKKEFAGDIGTTTQYVAKVENGHRGISFERAVHWARRLGLREHYFVEAIVLDELAAVNALTVVRVGSAA